MTLVIDTERDLKCKQKTSNWRLKTHYSSAGAHGWYFGDLKSLVWIDAAHNDVFVVYNFEMIETNFSSSDLTYLSSQMAEAAFAELWNKEDDDYWDSYL